MFCVTPVKAQTTLWALLPSGNYSVPPIQVEHWRAIEPLAPAVASPDSWRLEDGQAVDVQWIEVYDIDLPDQPGAMDAVLIVGWTDLPGVYLVTVAYRALGWHCKNAYFIRSEDWRTANAQRTDVSS